MKTLLTICLILFNLSLSAQQKDTKIPKKIQRSIPLLTEYLTSQKTADKDKVEAIYTWITENILYDYAQLQSEKYLTGVDPVTILKTKKSICTGYVELMKAMLDHISIKNETVSGYIHNMHWVPGKLCVKEEHTWIVVLIEGEWFLADPTWDAGYIGRIPTKLKPYKAKVYKKTTFKKPEKEKKVLAKREKKEIARKKKYDDKPKYTDKIGFVKDPKKEFFLIHSDTFLLTHLPIVPMWQLRDDNISIEEFSLPTDSLILLLDHPMGNRQDYKMKAIDYLEKNFIDQLIITGDEGASFNKYNPALKAVFYYNYMALISNKNLQKLARGSKYEITPSKYVELNAKTDTIIKYSKMYKEVEKIYYKQDKDYDKSHNKLSVEKDKINIKLLNKVDKLNDKIVSTVENDDDKIKESLNKIEVLEKKIELNYPQAFSYVEPKDLQKSIIQNWLDSISIEINQLTLMNTTLDTLRQNSKFNNILSNIDFMGYLLTSNANYIPFNSYSTTEVTNEIDSLITIEANNTLRLYTDSIPLEMLPKDLMVKLKRIESLVSKANSDLKLLTTEKKIGSSIKFETYLQSKLLEASQIVKQINMKSASFNSAVNKGLKNGVKDFKKVITQMDEQEKLKLAKYEYIQEETEKEHLREVSLMKKMNSDSKKWKSKFKG